MSDDHTAKLHVLQGLLDAFNRHDLAAIMAYFVKDGVLEMPRGMGNPLRWNS